VNLSLWSLDLSLYVGRPDSQYSRELVFEDALKRGAPRMPEFKKMINFAFVTHSASSMIDVFKNGCSIALLPSYVGRAAPTQGPTRMARFHFRC
jgi:hypothetical protein